WNVLFPHGSVGSNKRGLDVAQRGVDPFERGRLGGLRARAGDDRRVRASGLRHGGETFQAVGDDLGTALKRRARELGECEFTERLDAPQDDLMWLAVVRCLDCGDEGRLAHCAAPARAGTLAAEI